jgi:hypothetical protein
MTLPSVTSTIAGVVGIVVMAVVAARMITLFPAVAVDASVLAWSRAMAATKGNTWRILLIFLLAFLPLAFAGIAVTGLAVFVIGSVIASAMGKDAAATLTLAVVIAVWLAIIQTTAATLAISMVRRPTILARANEMIE